MDTYDAVLTEDKVTLLHVTSRRVGTLSTEIPSGVGDGPAFSRLLLTVCILEKT